MYRGESVLIDYTKSYSIGFNSSWFYVKRIKTGTWGWGSRTLIRETRQPNLEHTPDKYWV